MKFHLATTLLVLKQSAEAESSRAQCGSNYSEAEIKECQVRNFLQLKT